MFDISKIQREMKYYRGDSSQYPRGTLEGSIVPLRGVSLPTCCFPEEKLITCGVYIDM